MSQVRPRPPVPVELSRPTPPHLNSDAEIAEVEIPGVERAALAGSPGAALKLALHFDLVKMSQAKYLYWITIAAENGSPIGEYSLGTILAGKSGDNNRLRAIYWLRRAKSDGDTGCESVKSYPGCIGLLQRLEQGKSPKKRVRNKGVRLNKKGGRSE